MIESNNLHLGTVVSNMDKERIGKLLVSVPGISEAAQEVIYTSPYYDRNNGGFLSIPDPGADIILLEHTSGKLYYLCTVVDFPGIFRQDGVKDWDPIGDPYIYTDRDKPQRRKFTDSFGNGLVISSRTMPDFISTKVDLNSRAGKRISLSDSPKSDVVLIRNEHGDGMVISSEPTDVHSERSIEVKSKGAQRQVCFQSDISIMVIEGRDLTLENFSTGTNSISNQEGKKSGNINLRSQNRDINIVSKSQEGKIFIVTPKARIQIESDGSILIEAENKIQLKGSDITLHAANTLSVEAGSIDIKTNGDFKVDAGGAASVKSSGMATMDGSQVHLNSGLSQPVTVSPPSDPGLTDYDE